MSGEIKVNDEIYNMPMARLGLSNAEVADVMNYITNSWGNKNPLLITENCMSVKFHKAIKIRHSELDSESHITANQ